MKEKDLLKAIGKIDEKYLVEAQERTVKAEDSSEGESIVMGVDIMKERKTGKILGRIATVCAVAVLAVGTAFYIGRDDFSGGSDSDIEKEQLIVLVNGMTEKELESVSSDELSVAVSAAFSSALSAPPPHAVSPNTSRTAISNAIIFFIFKLISLK